MFQAFMKYISPAENPRPKLCQFFLRRGKFKMYLTAASHFHLPAVFNAKSITCMAALSLHLVLSFSFQKPQNLHSCLCLKDKISSSC